MATQDQLEIIRHNGEIEFYMLDPAKGITNIGRHPENDIVIDSPGVAPFHAMLDHRQAPYQLTILSQEGATTRVGGQSLSPQTPKALQHWDSIEIDGHTLILIETGSTAISPGAAEAAQQPPLTTGRPAPPVSTPAVAPVPLPVRPASFPPPRTRPEGPGSSDYEQAPAPTLNNVARSTPPSPAVPATAPRVTGLFSTRPPDHEDDAIIVDLSEQEWTIEVDQTATLQVTVTNGGDIVATFAISLQGLDESWVFISQPQVNLYEGERAVVTITITPPRLPTSRAGAHHFAVVVTSSNYPGRFSQRGATLIINPFYEYTVSELSPRRQSISWFKHFGRTTVSITNKGNSDTLFRLEGADDERACSFEFDVPGELVTLARQAELRFAPEETVSVPTCVTPHSRRLIGLRRRTYAFTITTSLLEGQQTPRSLLGELRSSPLIGPFWLLLMGLIMTVLILLLVRPRLNTFMFTDGGQTAVIRNGTPVAIRWGASIFTTDLTIDPPIEAIEPPIAARGTVVAFPREDTTYTLTGSNMLSRLVPSIFAAPTKAIKVDVVAIAPDVFFEAVPSQVVGEEEVILRWSVTDADKIELFRKVGNNPEELIGDFTDSPEAALSVTPQPNQDTTYILKASNAYVPTATPVPQLVTVLTPTPTVPPTPEIILFSANPQTINEGEASTLSWLVNGAQEVTIQGLDNNSALPASYDVEVKPTGSIDYFLTVPGVEPRPAHVSVIPATPTPTSTPEPTAPEITFFTSDPEEVVKGDSTEVELTWTIVGTTTNVELSSPELPNPLSNLLADGSFKISLDDTALFVLTAFNDTAKTSDSVQIDAVDPTPVPPPPTPTPIPAEILSFEITSPGAPRVVDLGGLNPHRYEVQIDTTITFRWETNSATKVAIFTAPGGGTENGGVPIGSTEQKVTERGSKNYTLIAENAEGQRTSPEVIQVDVVDQPPPNPPSNVLGTEDQANNQNKLEWRWTSDPNRNSITGFRVYRANVPGGSFTIVANSLPSDQFTFTDKIDPPDKTCGKAYYVVALYQDIEGNEQESPVSTNSWYSSPCP